MQDKIINILPVIIIVVTFPLSMYIYSRLIYSNPLMRFIISMVSALLVGIIIAIIVIVIFIFII